MTKTTSYKMSKISSERMLELEKILKECISKKKPFTEIAKKYKLEESLYLLYAYKMPIDSINNELIWYDTNKVNPILFINSLMEKYGVTKDEVIIRVQEIRRINKYNESINIKKKKI